MNHTAHTIESSLIDTSAVLAARYPETPKNKPSSVAKFLALSDELIDSNQYTYVEIAHIRATGWMVWLREK